MRIALAQLMALALLSLGVPGLTGNQQKPATVELVERFKNTRVFWQQLEVAEQIVMRRDTRVLQELGAWLTHEDRHLRGNAAFIFAGLGDERGFEVIRAILKDTSDRPVGQGGPGGSWTLRAQIGADRYYAVLLFGKLKARRAVPILVPLLRDEEINYVVASALGEIGDKSAIPPLIGALDDKDPIVRVLAIQSLEKLGAKEALPRLRALLHDKDKTRFAEQITVAEAARAAITKLQARP